MHVIPRGIGERVWNEQLTAVRVRQEGRHDSVRPPHVLEKTRPPPKRDDTGQRPASLDGGHQAPFVDVVGQSRQQQKCNNVGEALDFGFHCFRLA